MRRTKCLADSSDGRDRRGSRVFIEQVKRAVGDVRETGTRREDRQFGGGVWSARLKVCVWLVAVRRYVYVRCVFAHHPSRALIHQLHDYHYKPLPLHEYPTLPQTIIAASTNTPYTHIPPYRHQPNTNPQPRTPNTSVELPILPARPRLPHISDRPLNLLNKNPRTPPVSSVASSPRTTTTIPSSTRKMPAPAQTLHNPNDPNGLASLGYNFNGPATGTSLPPRPGPPPNRPLPPTPTAVGK